MRNIGLHDGISIIKMQKLQVISRALRVVVVSVLFLIMNERVIYHLKELILLYLKTYYPNFCHLFSLYNTIRHLCGYFCIVGYHYFSFMKHASYFNKEFRLSINACRKKLFSRNADISHQVIPNFGHMSVCSETIFCLKEF
jgi:hypothetical protein